MSQNHLFWLAVASVVMAAMLFKWWALRSWISVPGRIIGRDMVYDDYDGEGGRRLRPVVSYTVAGRTYEVTDKFGKGTSRIGDEIVVRYPRGYPANGCVDHPFKFAIGPLVAVAIWSGILIWALQ